VRAFAINSAACRIDIGARLTTSSSWPPSMKLHAEITGTIALADLVDGNDTRMIQTGSSLSFTTKALHVGFARPLTKANDF
jgi:hypothetical protein